MYYLKMIILIILMARVSCGETRAIACFSKIRTLPYTRTPTYSHFRNIPSFFEARERVKRFFDTLSKRTSLAFFDWNL